MCKLSRYRAKKLLNPKALTFIESSGNKAENIVFWARKLQVLRVRLDFIPHGYGESLFCLLKGSEKKLRKFLNLLGAEPDSINNAYAHRVCNYFVHAIAHKDGSCFINFNCTLNDQTILDFEKIDSQLLKSEFTFSESDDLRDVTPLTHPDIWLDKSSESPKQRLAQKKNQRL